MKKTSTRILPLLLALLTALGALTACGGQEKPSEPENTPSQQEPAAAGPQTPPEQPEESADGKLVLEGAMPLDYAEGFHIDLYEGGYRMITAGSGTGEQYLVVPEGKSVPEDLDSAVKVLQQPIENVYIASTGMVSLLDAIGALDAVKLVGSEVSGWYIDGVVERMEDGCIEFGGKYSEPDYEQMTAKGIQLHVDTTMVNNNPEVLEKFDELGIPNFVETSSAEGHPLARVEWVKVFGVILGYEEEAQRYFDGQKALLEAATAAESSGKTVAMGYITSSDKCYARNGGDYMAQMIGLAGGEYIRADMKPGEGGNSSLTFEDWYAGFKDADCLFYVNFARSFESLDDMIAYNPLFADFKSVQNGNVWVTSKDFTQSTAAIASIVSDMSQILASEDGDVTTDHLIKLS